MYQFSASLSKTVFSFDSIIHKNWSNHSYERTLLTGNLRIWSWVMKFDIPKFWRVYRTHFSWQTVVKRWEAFIIVCWICFLLDRKLLKVMEGEIVGKMMPCLFFPYNFSVNPPPFVYPSVSLHQLVPGMTQQKVWRSATLSIWSCRAPPTGRPGKGGRLYGNQWFSLHSPYLVPV